MKYYVVANSVQHSDLSIDDVLKNIKDGSFSLDDSAWYSGLSDWTRLGAMPEIVKELEEEKEENIEGFLKSDEELIILYGDKDKKIKELFNDDTIKFVKLPIAGFRNDEFDFHIAGSFYKNKSFFIIKTIDVNTKELYQTVITRKIEMISEMFLRLNGVNYTIGSLNKFYFEIFNKESISLKIKINNGVKYFPNNVINLNKDQLPKAGDIINVTAYDTKEVVFNIEAVLVYLNNEYYNVIDIFKED